MSNDLIPSSKIDKAVTQRDAAIRGYKDAWAALATARTLMQATTDKLDALRGSGMCISYSIDGLPDEMREYKYRQGSTTEAQFAAAARKMVDADAWSGIIADAGLHDLMDAEALREFRQQLCTDPPEFTHDSISATLLTMIGSASEMMARGVVNAFGAMTGNYRTNDAFKIGDKFIMPGALCQWGWTGDLHSSRRVDMLADMDRAIHVLGGLDVPDRMDGLVGLIDSSRPHRIGGPVPFACENDMWKVRAFKNGNLHIWCKRPDLIRKANKIIARYYGANKLAEAGGT